MNRQLLYNFRDKYKLLDTEEIRNLKTAVTKIKKYSSKNLDKLVQTAIKNFEKNGIIIHKTTTLKEAREKLADLINEEKIVIKSKSNTINLLQLDKSAKLSETDFIETDLGEFVAKLVGKHDKHPVLPSLSLSPAEITAKIKKKFDVNIDSSAESIANWVRNYLRQKIIEAPIGLTGANVLTSQGEIVLLENEGNISLASRLPAKHIVVAGIEKLVSSTQDAIQITKAQAAWGTGQIRTSYVSIIAGPSKSADIQNELTIGAQGAKEVHLILIDNRNEIRQFLADFAGKFANSTTDPSLKQDSTSLNSDLDLLSREIMKCINCGACMSLCPAYHLSNDMDRSEPQNRYTGIRFMISEILNGVFDTSMPFKCSTCHMCSNICPVGIDLPAVLYALRRFVPQSAGNRVMLERIEEFGNPFGEKPEEVDELFCC